MDMKLYLLTLKEALLHLNAVLVNLLPSKKTEFEVTYVIANEGWILEGMCRDIDGELDLKSHFHYSSKKIPTSDLYFFSHPDIYVSALLKSPRILKTNSIVQYTHHSSILGANKSLIVAALNKVTKIFCMNTATKDDLVSFGVSPDLIEVNFIGIDENLFFPQTKINTRPTIGFNLRYEDRKSYSERKNYNKIIDIIKKIDFCDVILLGKNWQSYDRFSEIKDLPHFTYTECSYREYPEYYRKMDVFVSVSKLEGGPVPMLEAMFCNVFPVVSNTGFAPDLIKQDENGILFDVDLAAEDIINKIRNGLVLAKYRTVNKSVAQLTWQNFSQSVSLLLK